jgi:hypothetical protein
LGSYSKGGLRLGEQAFFMGFLSVKPNQFQENSTWTWLSMCLTRNRYTPEVRCFPTNWLAFAVSL